MKVLKGNTARLLLVFLLMAMLPVAALAQSATTGGITGVVTDPSGAAVPNAQVTVTGPNLIRPQTATSAADGSYRIFNLPPGTYTVMVDAGQGFRKSERTNVQVNLGRTHTADIQIQVATAATEVTVTGEAATVNVETTTSGSNVTADQFLNFPTSRTVQGLYTIAPSVARSGLRDAAGRDRDPSVAGSSGPENNYILDGVGVADPAFGGGGANLPFEFVQEVEIKTGAYSSEYGKSTGGVFNVITKSGSNELHGDIFGYFTGGGLVREVQNFPFTGSAANGFSEQDIGGDLGGPIVQDKLWFFGAVNPQFRTNKYLTQTFHTPVENDVTTPFYAGKITWALADNHTVNFSTFGDFTKVDGYLASGVTGSALLNIAGFGSNPAAFQGTLKTGGHNYAMRLNSAFTPRFIGEFAVGLHYQRLNILPIEASTGTRLITDNFAVVLGNATVPVTHTGIPAGSGATPGTNTGFVDFVDGRGGLLQRNFVQGPGFGLATSSDRNRYEASARLNNVSSKHSLKYGFEWGRNIYNNRQISTGFPITYGNPDNVPPGAGVDPVDTLATDAQRVTNNFAVCTTRGSVIVCPNQTATDRLSAAIGSLPAGLTSVITGPITADEFSNNPFLVRLTTRVRDFQLFADTYTNQYAGYIQDDWKIFKNLQLNLGLRWDFQSAYAAGGITYLKLNQFWYNTQPRLGLIWDFTGSGRGKFTVNYARFIEAPIPLDINVRAGGGDSQIDRNFNVNTYGGPAGSIAATGFNLQNLGAHASPIEPGLRPQMLEEYSAGVEFAPANDFVLGMRGIYRNYINVIEDGSFDDGENYFIFNPGRRGDGETIEDQACATVGCFGAARRYYRGLEFSATKRFSRGFQFITSYTYSSLIGNYEGLFRNDNGQSDPNITSLFDLPDLLPGIYGRLPNDRPHQFKINGSYQTPWLVMLSGNFYVQSGSPFNMLTPHTVYGNNEGFGFCDDLAHPLNPTPGACTPRGTAFVPDVTASVPGFPNLVDSIGDNRTPVTHNLDLGFYLPIKLGEKKQLRLTADWFNVTNTQRAVTLDQTFAINSGVTGVDPVLNPFWGSALLVQPPSQWRFGAKFSF